MAIILNPIDPVAFSVFGLPVRWYALAYIAGFLIGYYLFKYLIKSNQSEIKLSNKQIDDFLTYVVLGVILGGRIGYVLFYNFAYFMHNPLEIFAVWQGGMSFHGGLIGLTLATFLFVRHIKSKYVLTDSFKILDMLSAVVPIGLGLGRIANFINMEIMGRITDSPLGVIFVGESEYPRHPSPLYEAFFEGLILFLIMWFAYTKTNLRKHSGAVSGLLCICYAVFRIFCEQFRQPDVQIGFLTSWGLTMGQLLSGVMIMVGAIVMICAFKRK